MKMAYGKECLLVLSERLTEGEKEKQYLPNPTPTE
jgi:hypothetical protein